MWQLFRRGFCHKFGGADHEDSSMGEHEEHREEVWKGEGHLRTTAVQLCVQTTNRRYPTSTHLRRLLGVSLIVNSHFILEKQTIYVLV